MSKRKDLSLAEKVKVINSLALKKTQTELAKQFGISSTQVSRINTNKQEILLKWTVNSNTWLRESEWASVSMLRLYYFAGFRKLAYSHSHLSSSL